MGSPLFYTLALFITVHLFLQEVAEGRALVDTKESKHLGQKEKDVLQRAIIEFGYRVGALELPAERRGPGNQVTTGGTPEEVQATTSSPNNYGNILGSTSDRYVYNLYWH